VIALLRRAVERIRAGEGGFTLVEMLVAGAIFLGLSTLMFSLVLTGARTVTDTRQHNDLNEEARLVLNRMSREIREAELIRTATNPVGPTWTSANDVSITFEVDFDGDTIIEESAADPEKITYLYSQDEQKLYLQAGGVTTPILAENVTEFTLDFTSSSGYLYDADENGTTTWMELDADPTGKVGNGNGVLDTAELKYIDSVSIEVTLLESPHEQKYRTTIDLRNSQSL
jgi:type II secretory pathway pseudopilin PulG